jgi:hypothetical protein
MRQIIYASLKMSSMLEEQSHHKPLRCKDCIIGKVLVDNGLALYVLPKHVLDEMPVDSTHILPRPSCKSWQVAKGSKIR